MRKHHPADKNLLPALYFLSPPLDTMEFFAKFIFQRSHEIPAKFNIRPDLRSLRPPANFIPLQLPHSGKLLICEIWISSWYTQSLFDLLLSGFWSPDAFSLAAVKFLEVSRHPEHTTNSTHQERAPFVYLLRRLEKQSLRHERTSPVAIINPLHEHITTLLRIIFQMKELKMI